MASSIPTTSFGTAPTSNHDSVISLTNANTFGGVAYLSGTSTGSFQVEIEGPTGFGTPPPQFPNTPSFHTPTTVFEIFVTSQRVSTPPARADFASNLARSIRGDTNPPGDFGRVNVDDNGNERKEIHFDTTAQIFPAGTTGHAERFVTIRFGRTNTAQEAYPVVNFRVVANAAPTAANDPNATAIEDVATDIDVLANDRDPDGDSLTLTAVSDPDHGSATIVAGKVRYTSDPNYNGPDAFSYTVMDPFGQMSTAMVTVAVTAANDPPVADLNGAAGGINTAVDFVEGAASGTLLAPGATVSDVDNANLASATIRLVSVLDGDAESLTVDVAGTAITATAYDPATGVLTLSGTDTVARYQQVLRTVRYRNTSRAPNSANRQVGFVVNDGSANSAEALAVVRITQTEDPPVVTAVRLDATEGTPLDGVTVATFTDPDAGSVASNYAATIDWGDGTPTTAGTVRAGAGGQFVVEGGHTYLRDGVFTVTVAVNQVDDPTQVDDDAATATVLDATPSAVGSAVAATEGAAFSGVLVATFTDGGGPDLLGDYAATIDWGDGTAPSAGTIALDGENLVVRGGHAYGEEGSYAVRVAITERGDPKTVIATTATVAPVPLVASPVTIAVTEGAALVNAVVATFTDVGGLGPNSAVGDYSATINWGDGTPATAGTITLDPVTLIFTVTGSHTYSNESPAAGFPVRVRIVEQGGSTGMASSVANVQNAPVSVAGVAVAAIEGVPLVNLAVATFVDTGGADPVVSYAATIDWGDGTPATLGVISLAGGTFTVRGGHAYAEEGSYTVRVSVRESGGSVTPGTGTAVVAPVPLLAQGLPVVATEGAALVGVTLATFTDVGGLGPNSGVGDYAAAIDWGDGTGVSAGAITLDGGTFTVRGGHTYADEGTYTIRVAIVEQGGSTGAASASATVGDAAIDVRAIPASPVEGVPLVDALVATFGVIDPNARAGEFSATIAWGDGTPATAGTVEVVAGSAGMLFAVRGSHAYALPGTFPMTVDVASRGGSTGSGSTPAVVADVPIVVVGARLDAAGDSGNSPSDRITNVSRPTFSGLSEPGSTLRLLARRSDAFAPAVVGTAVADASGSWRIAADALPDGLYDLAVMATDRAGISTSTTALAPILVDTAGPRVAGLKFNPRTGQVLITFEDERGLDLASLVRPGTVAFVRPNRPGRDLVANLALAPGSTFGSASLVATIDGGRRLGRGRFRVSVRSAGVADAAGNVLDGEFLGAVPSGDGRAGGDFAARLVTDGRRRAEFVPLMTSAGSPEAAVGRAVPNASLASRKAHRRR